MYTLRPYQQTAVDKAVNYMRKNSEPCLLELATGAGKSLICAEIAKVMNAMSKKKVLCLCPTAELVEQNYEKYLLTGNEASIYSASISKSMRHPVVFATGQSFIKIAKKFAHEFCAIIPDECHKIDNTFLEIVAILR